MTHEPSRRCVGCGAIVPKRELRRLVASDGEVVPDPDGRAPGRGAYLHPGAECLGRALQRGALERAFRRPVRVDEARLAGSEPLH